MFITSDYNKVEVENERFKYKFFLNNRDIYENQRDFVKELNLLIYRFSEDLSNKGLVVKSYDSNIKKVRQEILDKPWKSYRLKTIRKTPGILMIDTDFNTFNPDKDNWIYFYFIRDQRYKENRGNSFTIEEAEKLFDKLSEIIANDNGNVFEKVKKNLFVERTKRVGGFIAKEGISYEIAISADKFLNILNKIYRNLS